MVDEPRCGVAGKPLAVGERGIGFADVLTIRGNGIAEGVVAGEGRVLLPVLGQAPESMH